MSDNKDINLINSNKYKIQLKQLHYEDLLITDDLFEQIKSRDIKIKANTIDQYEVVDFDNETITIKFIRKRSFEPKVIFDINVVLEVTFDINDKCDKEINMENIGQELEDRKTNLLMPATTTASLLISNITNVNSNSLPVITPPFLKEIEK